MPGRRLRLREKRNMSKVTLPISHEGGVTTQKAGLSGSKPTLSLPCYILELPGKEKVGRGGKPLQQSQRSVPLQAKGFLCILSPCGSGSQRVADGACWEQLQVQGDERERR